MLFKVILRHRMENENLHVVPSNDIEKHILKENYPCCPEVEEYNGCKLIIHNSYDQRERVEILTQNVLTN